ncbi:histidine kinase [Aequorivita sp. Q41]|uniref:sensor histidine kinase n=1 Tax=Aequorivita sp. Q41 TaxID=3153300 RepID=UPI003242EA58
MIKKTLLLYFIIGFTSIFHGQDPTPSDSLQAYLQTFSDESERLAVFAKKISENKIAKDEGYISLLESYITLAIANSDWENALVFKNTLATYLLFDTANPKKAYHLLSAYKGNLNKASSIEEIANFYLIYAETATYMQEYKVSLDILMEGILFLESEARTEIRQYADMHLTAGENSSKINNIIKSAGYFKKASELYIAQKDTIPYLWSQNGLSRLMGNYGLFDEAVKARETIFLWQDALSQIDVVVMAHITAAIEATMQDLPEAELCHTEQALLLKDQMSSDIKPIIEILANACATYTYARQGFLKKSDENLKQLKSAVVGFENNSFLKTYYSLAEAQNAYAHADYLKTINSILSSLAAVKKSKEPEIIMDYEHLLAQSYEELGNTKQSLVHFKNYINLKDSIQKTRSQKRFVYVHNEFELEKKDFQINKQKKNIALLNAENRIKTQWMLFGGIGFILLFLTIYLFRTRAFVKRNQKLQKIYSQNLIQSIEKERKRIAGDLHDSIGQSLLIIKNKFLTDKNIEDSTIVDKALEEVREISQDLHPYKFENIGLINSLKNTIETLQKVQWFSFHMKLLMRKALKV